MTRRFYVTMTWEEWPDQGAYTAIVDATDSEDATRTVMHMMAANRGRHDEVLDEDLDAVLEHEDWHVAVCFNIDEFIAEHKKPPTQ